MKTLDIEKLSARISAHADAELRENRIGGKEILICQKGACVYHETFGFVSPGVPLQKNMLYRMASMTKPVTAAAVLQLADRALIDLDAPLSEYFPEAKQMYVAEVKDGRIAALTPAKNEIPVADLLSHTGGIACGPTDTVFAGSTAALPLKEAVPAILRMPLAFEPRTAQAYSGTGAFDVAAGLVEKVTGTDFASYLRKNLFAPLGMKDTTFEPTPAQWERMAPMHSCTPAGESENVLTTPGCVFENYVPARRMAGGGLASTAEDYSRFAEMLRRDGLSKNGAEVLSEAAVQRMYTPRATEEIMPGSERWGLGVRVIVNGDYPHGLGEGCFGWSGAYGTHFWVDRKNRLTVVMLKNSRFDGGAGNRSACELEEDVSASLV
jgi:CubicO group peptidase (beta-lactamase class C family)